MIEIYRKAAGQLGLFPSATWGPETLVYAAVPWTAVRHLPAALATLRRASRDLGIRRPHLAFYVPLDLAAQYGATSVAFGHGAGLRGITYPSVNVIYVDALLSKREMVEVVAHETRHLAQHSDDVGEPAVAAQAHEAEAGRYGRRVARGTCARRTGLQPTRRRPRPLSQWVIEADASSVA